MNLLFIQDENGAQSAVVTNEEITAGQEGATADASNTTTGEVAEDVIEQPEPTFMGQYGMWIMIIAMIAIMYFFMWRPESKRRKQMENFRKGLKKGDKIITAGGIYGVIKEVHETSLLIEVDSNVTLRIDKNMVVGDPTQGVMQQ